MTSDQDRPRIIELAATISTSVTRLQDKLAAKGVPSPSFAQDAPILFPTEVSDDRDAILDATAELYDLLLEPLNLLFKHGGHNNMASLQAISRLGIAAMVPLGDQTSFSEIARKAGLTESMTGRLLRHAITMRVFREPEPSMVAHTKASKMITMPHINDWLRTGSEEMWPPAVKLVDAIERWHESDEPHETAYALANNGVGSLYDAIGADPERAARFSSAMKAYASSPELDVSHVLDNYDWAALGQARVTDIGGGQGHVAIELARRFEGLHVIVQDMEKVVKGAEAGVPVDLKERVDFIAHDFFSPQTVVADVYYLRWILHNWSDKYCIIILQTLIPALRPGSRVLIQDTCMPEPGTVALWREKDLRSADLNMAALFNSRERTVREWKTLLAEADRRYELKKLIEPKGSALALLDVRWNTSE